MIALVWQLDTKDGSRGQSMSDGLRKSKDHKRSVCNGEPEGRARFHQRLSLGQHEMGSTNTRHRDIQERRQPSDLMGRVESLAGLKTTSTAMATRPKASTEKTRGGLPDPNPPHHHCNHHHHLGAQPPPSPPAMNPTAPIFPHLQTPRPPIDS